MVRVWARARATLVERWEQEVLDDSFFSARKGHVADDDGWRLSLRMEAGVLQKLEGPSEGSEIVAGTWDLSRLSQLEVHRPALLGGTASVLQEKHRGRMLLGYSRAQGYLQELVPKASAELQGHRIRHPHRKLHPGSLRRQEVGEHKICLCRKGHLRRHEGGGWLFCCT